MDGILIDAIKVYAIYFVVVFSGLSLVVVPIVLRNRHNRGTR